MSKFKVPNLIKMEKAGFESMSNTEKVDYCNQLSFLFYTASMIPIISRVIEVSRGSDDHAIGYRAAFI